MAGPYIDAPTLKQALADALKKPLANLQGYWDSHVTRALASGWRDLNAILTGKGFTTGQIDQWDDRVSYNLDQSLFWCFVYGAGLGDYSDRDTTKLDHRKELIASATIMIAGAAVAPNAAAPVSGADVGRITMVTDGLDYGTTFGLKVLRSNGTNEYGDRLPNGWWQ